MARINTREPKQGLVNKRNQSGQKSRAEIPGEITIDHYSAINNILMRICDQTKAMQVVARLNETGKDEAAPVFVGWVESDKRARVRLARNDPAPGLLRAGDTASSTTYDKCFYDGSVERDWTRPEHVQERRSNELCLSQKTGVTYLVVIRIEVREDGKPLRGVGVLGAGFDNMPDDTMKTKEILKKWASDALVPYLTEHFELGGRVL